ncbi:Uncharacterised protein [Vibrio cholerae]|nr:Uncharacterised protein [Vibrio cholerae]CSI68751.1 Uncharacterised protein [Vibrio cholerae]
MTDPRHQQRAIFFQCLNAFRHSIKRARYRADF